MLNIQDNTIRDGMQQKGISKDTLTKRNILNLISSSSIDSVEVGMCVTPEDFQMLSKQIAVLPLNKKAVILTRMIKEDIDLAYKLYKKYPNVVLKLLVPVSKLHIEKKLNSRNFFRESTF